MADVEKKPARAGLAKFLKPAEDTQCLVCSKRVYEMEKLTADNKLYHKTCFKCSKCKCTLRVGNYASMEGQIFCKPHFISMFKEKGNYDEGFGKEQHKKKWTNKGPENGGATSSNGATSSVGQGGLPSASKPKILPKPKPAVNGLVTRGASQSSLETVERPIERTVARTVDRGHRSVSEESVEGDSMPVSASLEAARSKFTQDGPTTEQQTKSPARPPPNKLRGQWDPEATAVKTEKAAAEELKGTAIPAASSLMSRYQKAVQTSATPVKARGARLGSSGHSEDTSGARALKGVNMKNILAKFQSGDIGDSHVPSPGDRTSPRPLKIPSFDRSGSPAAKVTDPDRPRTVGQVQIPNFERQQRGASVDKPEGADKPTPSKVKIPDFQRQRSSGKLVPSEDPATIVAASGAPTKNIRDMFESKKNASATSSGRNFDLKAELEAGTELEKEHMAAREGKDTEQYDSDSDDERCPEESRAPREPSPTPPSSEGDRESDRESDGVDNSDGEGQGHQSDLEQEEDRVDLDLEQEEDRVDLDLEQEEDRVAYREPTDVPDRHSSHEPEYSDGEQDRKYEEEERMSATQSTDGEEEREPRYTQPLSYKSPSEDEERNVSHDQPIREDLTAGAEDHSISYEPAYKGEDTGPTYDDPPSDDQGDTSDDSLGTRRQPARDVEEGDVEEGDVEEGDVEEGDVEEAEAYETVSYSQDENYNMADQDDSQDKGKVVAAGARGSTSGSDDEPSKEDVTLVVR